MSSDSIGVGIHRQRPTAEQIAAASAETATPISDGIWMSPGLSNSYLVSGRTRRIVINTGMGFEAPVHRAVFDAVDDRPTALVVITQGHYDHVGGINHFLDPDGSTEVAAGKEWATWKADNDRLGTFRAARAAFAFWPKVIAGIEHTAERFPGADTTQGEITPTLEVHERRTLEVDGVTLELIPVHGGETRDSLVVWLPDRRICFSGNALGPLFAHVPNLVTLRGDRYRDPLDYIDTVETLRALGAETLVTGHWDPIRGGEVIERELSNLRDAMQHVHDRTVAGMNAGADVHTLMKTVTLPDHLDVGENYGLTRWNVRAIWESYAGWFHARSTTELYAVPAHDVHADLVAVAGVSAIVEAARRRLAANEPVAAIHLAEIAAATSPDAHAVLDVLIEAHRTLLDASQNFWERAWLTKQIDELTTRHQEATT